MSDVLRSTTRRQRMTGKGAHAHWGKWGGETVAGALVIYALVAWVPWSLLVSRGATPVGMLAGETERFTPPVVVTVPSPQRPETASAILTTEVAVEASIQNFLAVWGPVAVLIGMMIVGIRCFLG